MSKVDENRMRRLARRRGLELVKSRRRDAGCPWFGRYVLVEAHGDRVIACIRGRGFTLIECGTGGAERHGAWLALHEIEGVLDGFSTISRAQVPATLDEDTRAV